MEDRQLNRYLYSDRSIGTLEAVKDPEFSVTPSFLIFQACSRVSYYYYGLRAIVVGDTGTLYITSYF